MDNIAGEVPAEKGEQQAAAQARDEAAAAASHRSLERLRDRIDTAAQEITRLRRQNAELAQRIISLESGDQDYASLLASGEDAEALKRKINTFMEAIDEYLNEGGAATSGEQTK